jgi:Glycosyltransferase family 92
MQSSMRASTSAKQLLRSPFVWRARYRDGAIERRLRHELAVAAIFREEAPFLDEWLTFHAGIGVGHFYLYNNFSTDEFRDVLGPWIARGMVTLTEWPVEVGQLPAYRHCVRHAGDTARWIAFIDIDEFLFSPTQRDIRPILADYRDLPGLIVYSPYFGASGHRTRPAGAVVEAYTRRAPLTHVSAKTIANPRWIYRIRNVHVFKYWAGDALDTDRKPLIHGRAGALDRLRLNHYWSRSLQDLDTKIRRGDASSAADRRLQWHLEYEAKLNAEEDRTILPISRSIREHADQPNVLSR